jgi:hypothetical protein
MILEARRDLLAAPTQLAHAIEEPHLRRAGLFGTIKQGIVGPDKAAAKASASTGNARARTRSSKT